MYNLLVRFFKFIVPIFRSALVTAAAVELDRMASHDQDYRRYRRYSPRNSYSRYNPRGVTYHRLARPRLLAEQDEFEKIAPEKQSPNFHDVIMVAFDLTGPNAQIAQQWLMDNLPKPGFGGDVDEIELDSWWIANDERYDRSDCDSAVFVTKGNQEAARKLLRKEGLAQ